MGGRPENQSPLQTLDRRMCMWHQGIQQLILLKQDKLIGNIPLKLTNCRFIKSAVRLCDDDI